MDILLAAAESLRTAEVNEFHARAGKIQKAVVKRKRGVFKCDKCPSVFGLRHNLLRHEVCQPFIRTNFSHTFASKFICVLNTCTFADTLRFSFFVSVYMSVFVSVRLSVCVCIAENICFPNSARFIKANARSSAVSQVARLLLCSALIWKRTTARCMTRGRTINATSAVSVFHREAICKLMFEPPMVNSCVNVKAFVRAVRLKEVIATSEALSNPRLVRYRRPSVNLLLCAILESL